MLDLNSHPPSEKVCLRSAYGRLCWAGRCASYSVLSVVTDDYTEHSRFVPIRSFPIVQPEPEGVHDSDVMSNFSKPSHPSITSACP